MTLFKKKGAPLAGNEGFGWQSSHVVCFVSFKHSKEKKKAIISQPKGTLVEPEDEEESATTSKIACPFYLL